MIGMVTMVLSKEQIHKVMSHIHSKDTKPEILLRKALWHRGLRYRKNYKKLPGTPDIAITRCHIAIFVDGDFWHAKGHREHPGEQIGSNKEYVRKVLKETITLTLKDDGYCELSRLPDDHRFFTFQNKFLRGGDKAPSHLVIQKAIKLLGKDYRYQEGDHPVKSLRDRENDNTSVARLKK